MKTKHFAALLPILLAISLSSAFGAGQKIKSEFDKDDWWAERAAIFFPRYQFKLSPTSPVFATRSRPNLEYFLPAVGPDAVTGTAKDFSINTALNAMANYSPSGLPTNINDVRITTGSGTALTISSSPNVVMESLTVANGTSYSIANATAGGVSRTLTLGNSAGFTNVFSGVANDLIFLSGNSNLTIQGPNASTGTGTLSLALANSGNFNIATGSTLTIDANITGSVSITKTGGGTAVINPSKTFYTGNTIINGGTLVASAGDYFGPLNSSITINAGTLRYDATYLGGGNTIVVGSSSSAINVNGSSVTYTPGIISGSSANSLTKLGAGNLDLDFVNTFSGAFVANGGDTVMDINGALGSVSSVTIASSVILQNGFTNLTNTINDAAPVTLNGELYQPGSTETIASLSGTDPSALLVTGDITVSSTLYSGSFTVGNSASTTFAGVISGTRAAAGPIFTKQGTGTLTLTNANTYTGQTLISNGTLSLDNAGSTTPRLVNTTNITVNSGGTLLLASSSGSSTDRINNSATMTLNGGTFNTGGLSEHGATNNTAGLGALTLQSSSIIDMGSATSILAFANSALQAANWSGTLSIYNWSGMPVTGGGTDQLFFGNSSGGLLASQLLDFQFYSGAGTGAYTPGATILTDGEVVPLSPVPEPSTWIAGALAVGVVGWSFTKKKLKSETLKS